MSPRIRGAIQDQAAKVARAAHLLRGSVGNFGAQAAFDAAGELEERWEGPAT